MKEKFEPGNYDLWCLLRFVLRHLWMVVLAALTCVMGVYLLQNSISKPVYTSSVTFAVTSRNVANSAVVNIAVTDTVAEQFAGLLSSDLVRQAAAQQMGMEQLPAQVEISVPEYSNILVMKLTADSPELAYRSALALIQCHTTYSETVFQSAIIDAINGPSIPEEPSNLSTRNTLMRWAAPLGAVAMCAVLILLAILSDTVQTVNGAKRQLDSRLLTTVYHERNHRSFWQRVFRVKKSILISNPTCSFYYTETIHQLRVQVERAAETGGKRTFLVSSCHENEGKSTIAANLALSLAQKHRRVLLLDADLRKPAQHLIFEAKIPHGQDLGSLLSRRITERELLEAIQYDERSGLHTLFATPLRKHKGESVPQDVLKRVLRCLQREFDYIIVDTPPIGLFADTQALAELVDASILVVRQDMVPAAVVNDAIDSLNEASSHLLGYVFNNVRQFRILGLRDDYGYGYGYGYGKKYGRKGGHHRG